MHLRTPTVVGKIVTLRGYTKADIGLVMSVVDDPLVPLITSVPAGGDASGMYAYIDRQTRRAASGEGLQFVIVDNGSGESVGQIGLTFKESSRERASVGYWISPRYRRRGYAGAALHELAAWAVADGVHRLELYAEPWNEGSWRAAESAGFSREGLLKRWERVGAQRRDMYMYALLSDEYGVGP